MISVDMQGVSFCPPDGILKGDNDIGEFFTCKWGCYFKISKKSVAFDKPSKIWGIFWVLYYICYYYILYEAFFEEQISMKVLLFFNNLPKIQNFEISSRGHPALRQYARISIE